MACGFLLLGCHSEPNRTTPFPAVARQVLPAFSGPGCLRHGCPWLRAWSRLAWHSLTRELLLATQAGSPLSSEEPPNPVKMRVGQTHAWRGLPQRRPGLPPGARPQPRSRRRALGNAWAPALGCHVGAPGVAKVLPEPAFEDCSRQGPSPAPNWPERLRRPGFSPQTYSERTSDISCRPITGSR